MSEPRQRRYSNEEVSSILRRAIERQSDATSMTHDELVDAAREIGVSADDLERAAIDEEIEREVRAIATAKREKAKRALVGGAVTFVVLNALFVVMNLYVGGALWFPYVIAIWGTLLAAQAYRTLGVKEDPSEERALRDRITIEIKARRAPEAQGDPIAHGARELGAAMKDAFGVIMKSASDGLREIADDLGGKVDRDKGERVRVEPEPPRERVVTREEEARARADAEVDADDAEKRARR